MLQERKIFEPALLHALTATRLNNARWPMYELRWLIANGENVLKPEKRPVTSLLMMHKRAEIRYEPLGVVAALVSWNYPVFTF